MINSRQGKLGLAAVAAVALAAAGAAFAASRMHGSTSSTRGGFGPPGMAAGYGRGQFGHPGGGFGDHDGRGLGLLGSGLQAAATYLGLSQTQLFNELRSGKTLAQIASSTSGKSTDGLVDALVSAEQAELAQAVKNGRLSQSQADQIGASLKARITAMINGSFGGGHRFGDGGHGVPPGSPPVAPTHI